MEQEKFEFTPKRTQVVIMNEPQVLAESSYAALDEMPKVGEPITWERMDDTGVVFLETGTVASLELQKDRREYDYKIVVKNIR